MKKSDHKFKIFWIAGVILLIQMRIVFNAAAFENEKMICFTDIDGLPRNITTCLEQDHYGYIWIGTVNGMAQYDGNSFKTFDQLRGKGINDLCVDKNNNLWLATTNGLLLYNRITNDFELKSNGYIQHVNEDQGNVCFIENGNIQRVTEHGVEKIVERASPYDFCFTKDGLWLSTPNEGVKRLNRKSGFSVVDEQLLLGKTVWVLREIDGTLFMGCSSGELFIRSANGSFKSIPLENYHNIKEITKIGNEIWIATDGNGIVVLDSQLNYLRTISRSQNQAQTINSNSIYDIMQGANGEIWIASYGGGLTCILPGNQLFKNMVPEKGNSHSLIANEGTAVFYENGNFYFGTNYGMTIWNEPTNGYTHFTMDKLKNELKGTKVMAICTDNDGSIWIGTHDGLLGKYNSKNKLIKAYKPCGFNSNVMQQIIMLHNFNNQNLLIGTQYQDHSLLNFDLKTEAISIIQLNGNKNFMLNSIRENQHHELLASVLYEGLFTINLKNGTLENRLPELNKRIGFMNTDFYHDSDGFYWFTTSNEGLIRISEDGTQLEKWTEKEGLPTNSLFRIESVDDQSLWISSIAGICCFDRKTKQVTNFNHRDGLAGNEFKDFVSTKTPDGRIIFGSVAGFTLIDPAKFVADTSKYEVFISDITFQNQSIKTNEGKSLLTVPLEEPQQITLPYSHNSFTIHFFTRNKDLAKYNDDSYRLVGFDDRWNHLFEMNQVNYTNLSPGTYTFEVQSSPKKNIGTNPITRLIIRIKPPWYQSWYAFVVYLMLVSMLIYGAFTIFINRILLKKEKEISDYKIQKEYELTEKKLSFFTNISHDLKTPLTLIDAPVNDLLQSTDLKPEQISKLLMIRRNSKRLYKLITDLLEFRKLTQKQVALEVSETDVVVLIDEIFMAFHEECKGKSITFIKHTQVDRLVYIDRSKVEKIVWNLLSNAIQFTPPQGEIVLSANNRNIAGEMYLELMVSDTGIGIPTHDQTLIFNSFYQVKGTTKNRAHQGTGIGLSIVKDLTELHHGQIEVESEPGNGATFQITLPVERNHYAPSEIVSNEIEPASDLMLSDENMADPIDLNTKQKQYNVPKILIVEDNSDLRDYLVDHFKQNYQVYDAEDGFVGFTIAQKINPDLILTDVQMPNRNGYGFCREIRQHFDTSHIPVVMLTANSTTEQQIEGLNTGADAYMTKPFDIKLLDTVLSSLLENRRRLRYKLLGVETDKAQEQQLPQKDLDFIETLKSYIEENMSSANLNVEQLCDRFSVSRSQLNRKIKALTGSTPNNLIKTIRLKKAYQLIRNEGLRVSEAAYLTGFTDPNNFSTSFKKEFGENPSQVGGVD